MEFLLAIPIVALAAGGLALGLAWRRPVRTSCSGLTCLPDAPRCAGCPRRRAEAAR